jgi:hypothetical protein
MQQAKCSLISNANGKYSLVFKANSTTQIWACLLLVPTEIKQNNSQAFVFISCLSTSLYKEFKGFPNILSVA